MRTPRFMSLLAFAAIFVAGCGEHSGNSAGSEAGGAGSGGEGSAATEKLALVSTAYKALGGVVLLNPNDLAASGSLYEAKGHIGPPTAQSDRHGLVFNRADGLFWGFASNSANRFGALISFDPSTDAVVIEAQNPNLALLGQGLPPVNFYTTPLISDDGKSLLVVTQGGGRETLQSQSLGDGLMVHVNIDRGSPNFGRFTPVYEFFAYGESIGDQLKGIRHVTSTPVWGLDASGKQVIYLLSEGEKWQTQGADGSGEVPAKVFSLGPTDAADLSKPWAIRSVADINPPHYLSGLLALDPVWDQARKRLVYSYGTDNGEIFVKSTTDWIADILSPSNQGCYLPKAMWMSASNDYGLLCQGFVKPTDDLPGTQPRLVEVGVSGESVVRRAFYDWQSLTLEPYAAVQSTSTRSVAIQLDSPIGLTLGPDFDGANPSRLEWLDPLNDASYTLVTGSEESGRIFAGRPALGGGTTRRSTTATSCSSPTSMPPTASALCSSTTGSSKPPRSSRWAPSRQAFRSPSPCGSATHSGSASPTSKREVVWFLGWASCRSAAARRASRAPAR